MDLIVQKSVTVSMEVFVMELQANVNVQLDLLETSVKKVCICKSVLKATENWPILLKKIWALFFSSDI